jgi:hypothetical protein
MEPNPISLKSGSSKPYAVFGIDGSDSKAELTNNPRLRITSTDERIVAVDRVSGRLIGKAPGIVEIRVSFSECTSLLAATVR